MKNALLIYKPVKKSFNIGDYIQSLAAKQYLPKVDIFLNREELNLYNDEDCKLILNGWFLHETSNWPPSDKINPLFVSFHLNSLAYNILERKEVIDYMRNHEPIGCRDRTTQFRLMNYGIDSYYSGCLTLTLSEKYIANNKEREGIYFVEPHYDRKCSTIFDILFELIGNFNVINQITKKKYKHISVRNLLKVSSFVNQYKSIFSIEALISATYIQHQLSSVDYSFEEDRFSLAEKLIREYANAKLVVTSKIHCALPCLSLETPVIYIDDLKKSESSSCRLDGLIELFNVVTYDNGKFRSDDIDLMQGNIEKKNLLNKQKHLELKDSLIQRCKDFIKDL